MIILTIQSLKGNHSSPFRLSFRRIQEEEDRRKRPEGSEAHIMHELGMGQFVLPKKLQMNR